MDDRQSTFDRWWLLIEINMEAFIKAISYYLPEKVLTNEDLVREFPEWTVDKIAAKIGVKERHIAADNETAGDMAVKAAEKLFVEHSIDRNDIDFVLLCTQSPDYFLPPTACLIQNRLNLKTSCGAFDINLGCSGYEYALATAKGYLVSGVAKNVLILTSETYSKHIHKEDKGNRTIFGDAAAATLVSVSGFARIMEFTLGTDGGGFDLLIHKTGAWRHKEEMNDLHWSESGTPLCSDNLFMDGKGIFDFTADMVPKMMDENLIKNGLSIQDINLFVFHQANKYMINYLRKLIGIDEEKFYFCLEHFGNTVSSTIPIALVEAKKEDLLHGYVSLAGFGVGLSYGAVIIDCN